MNRLLIAGLVVSALFFPMDAAALDGKRMMDVIETLASDDYEGRGIGTTGLSKAANYIAARFEAAGLKPGGEFGYFQTFSVDGPDGKPVRVKNVVGVIPGSSGPPVVLSAHYDHLGYGWPDARDGFEGRIHPGADDNASGIAVMLEVARSLVDSAPERGIIVLATCAEEVGLQGARHYVENLGGRPAEKVHANVNLDTVGRAGDRVMVFGGASAAEWSGIFTAAGTSTGVEADLVKQEITASDHTAFLEAGIPAVHLFGSPTSDYHRPSDTADKIDPAGMMRVAALTREVVENLVSRLQPLTGRVQPLAQAAKTPPPAGKRKGRTVSTGTVPDFTYAGEGVRVKMLADDSPGARAGLRPGDVITAFGGEPVKDLPAYTVELGKYDPGDRVEVEIERDGEKLVLELVLGRR